MRKVIFDSIDFPIWAKNDARYQKLHELDLYLDGEIYDHLPHSFYEEETSTGVYIQVKNRRPAVRFNIFAAVADQVARDTFAGYNAPTIEHKNEKIRLFIEAIKQESKILSHMLELTNWATTGSSVVTFAVQAKDKKAKVVLKTWRAKQCTPFFNELNELVKLRVHYIVSGAQLMTMAMEYQFDGKPVKADQAYWYIRDYEAGCENTYYPIPERAWRPVESNSTKLVPIPNFAHETALDFVPAHWFTRRTGKIRPYDGRCVWEGAIPNIIEFDYSMSMMGAGVRYNAAPQVVIKGQIENQGTDGRFIGGPSRYIHFGADKKLDDGLQVSGADAHLLEASGTGMKVGIENYGALLEKIAKIVICASRKDPDKLTTAMSAKGMETLDKEYHNLIQEFRTICGDEGYLELLKKLGAACIAANHPLVPQGMTQEDLDGLKLKWPPINPVGAQEFLYLCNGAAMLLQAQEPQPAAGAAGGGGALGGKPAAPVAAKPEKPILTRDELRSYLLGSIDSSIDSANKDYLTAASPSAGESTLPAELSDEEREAVINPSEFSAFEDAAAKAVMRGTVIDTSFNVGEGA